MKKWAWLCIVLPFILTLLWIVTWYCESILSRCTFRDHIEDVELEGQHSAHCDDKFLVVARCLASKVLSNACVHLVNVDMPVSSDADNASGLCLRFSGEILSNSKPCLITVTADGKLSGPLEISVKVNCEEPIFGLNLLNRVVAFLQWGVCSVFSAQVCTALYVCL